MWIGIVTLFPEMFNAITEYGIVGKAVKNGLLSIKFWNPRFFTSSFYKNIDDYPYGGGGGMLMKAEPLKSAIDHAKKDGGLDTKVIYMSPQGKRLNQKFVYNLSKSSKLILVCGRYSGIDERLIRTEIDEEWSIGDYIISGGELAAMVLIDAISRLIPGVLNNSKSSLLDSFVAGRLNFPNYTRPRVFKGIQVPSVLLTGNHKDIARWRLKQSLGQTWIKRPDLLKNLKLTQEEKMLLLEFKDEYCSKE